MPVTTKAIIQELARLGHDAYLGKGDGYYFFFGGDAKVWLDKTVRVPTLSSFTLEQWVAEYLRLKKLNEELSGDNPKSKNTSKRSKKP